MIAALTIGAGLVFILAVAIVGTYFMVLHRVLTESDRNAEAGVAAPKTAGHH